MTDKYEKLHEALTKASPRPWRTQGQLVAHEVWSGEDRVAITVGLDTLAEANAALIVEAVSAVEAMLKGERAK